MSEEKLTVAELLARRQQEGKTSETPRRRRRRSLEEGGVSVSELTGSIPRVKGSDPRRGAHALSNSEDDDKTKASDLLADEAAAKATAAGQEAEAPVGSAEVEVEEPAEETVAEAGTEAEADAEDTETVEPTAPAETAETVETEQGEEEQPAQAAQVAQAPTAQAPAAPKTPQAPEMPVPMAIPMEPRPVMVNSERAEITYTFTELRDFNDEAVKIGAPGPVAQAALTGSNSYDDRPTASIPVITEEIASAMAENKKTKAEAQTAEEAERARAAEATQAAEETSEATAVAEVTEPEATQAAAIAEPKAEAAAGTEESAAADVVKRDDDSASRAEVAEEEDYAEDNSLSVPLLLIQVFVGLIVGALIFFGFTMAWSSLPTVVTVIMAVVVTGGFVGLANYLRRKKDVATPILAGLVGLALTFGPWLIFQL
ncbi:MAG: hypothetical protein Q4E11_10015 [Corynebacterium sp.]|uniref:hypothetical protein n=1 Tax=Corynebacterium sp. TaxID=1720 RepID=UPI0026DB316E|nr:hypothetical protein [Corynebacterium sp.]MDO5030896.1 hypothetical protein [Corynebacterium sp.]